jgi:hypothetical protein
VRPGVLLTVAGDVAMLDGVMKVIEKQRDEMEALGSEAT